MAYLEITDVYKKFDDTEVLKGVSLSLEKGEVLSLIGSSGSGKTTLLRCMNFLLAPDGGKMVLDGEVLFDGDDKSRISDKQLREKRLNFGLVFQSFNLFPQYNVFKNITLAPILQLKEEARKLRKEKGKSFNKSEYVKEGKKRIEEEAEALLLKIGLTEKKNSYPGDLSGGQSQRVAIARALALKPNILCFDEPTSALDPELTGEVLKVIRALKDENRTMIIVTHEMEFAKNVSDKVVFMSQGVIKEEGDAKEVFENPKTEELISFLKNSANK